MQSELQKYPSPYRQVLQMLFYNTSFKILTNNEYTLIQAINKTNFHTLHKYTNLFSKFPIP